MPNASFKNNRDLTAAVINTTKTWFSFYSQAKLAVYILRDPVRLHCFDSLLFELMAIPLREEDS